jgi:hypothetical protein
MKPKRLTSAQRRRLALAPADLSVQGVGLALERYGDAVRYLFDRPVPAARGREWYWELDEPELDASPLQWTRIQTVLFANAAVDLAPFSDDQVGMGLNYLMDNGLSDVPYAAVDASVPLDEAIPLAGLHRPAPRRGARPDRFGVQPPRLRLPHVVRCVADVLARATATALANGRLAGAARKLRVPCREVQAAALHGIGHELAHLDRRDEIEKTVAAFIRSIDSGDLELKNYADAAGQGRVL